jgi:DNA-binding transcriptional regulator YiaG
MNKQAFLACRIREIRERLYGENGAEMLARALNVPVQTWRNYERGVTMPAHVLLEFLELTGSDPASLLTDDGEPSTFGWNADEC